MNTTNIDSCYIDHAYSENTGGGCMVDFIKLKNGMFIGVNDDSIVLYRNIDDIYEGRSDYQSIDITREKFNIEETLIKEFNEFLKANKFPKCSADELYFNVNMNEWQKRYVADFIRRWEMEGL